MNWLRKIVVVVGVVVGMGCGNTVLAVTTDVSKVNPKPEDTSITLGNGDLIILGTNPQEDSSWKSIDIKVTGTGTVIGGFNTVGRGGEIEVRDVTFSNSGSLTVDTGKTADAIGTTFIANSIALSGGNTLTITKGNSATKANKVRVAMLASNSNTKNTIIIGGFSSLEVTGSATFDNTIVTLNDGAVLDLQNGFTINKRANIIAETESSLIANATVSNSTANNIAAFGNAGLTAGKTDAINIGKTNKSALYIMTNATDPIAATTGPGTAQLRVTAEKAITMASNSSLHVGDYTIGSEVVGNSDTAVDIYNEADAGTVYAKTFTVESGANAKASGNVTTIIEGDAEIAGHYTLASNSTNTTFGGDTIVTGTLESSGSATINTNSGTTFTADGAYLKNLTLTSKGNGVSSLNFARNAGTVEGNITAENYALKITTDINMKTTTSSITAKTYLQDGGKVEGHVGSKITATDDSMTYFRNGAEFSVYGSFGGDVSVLGGSKLIGTENTINSSKTKTKTMTIDGTSGIDLTMGNLNLTNFKEIRSQGYLYLGTDENGSDLNTLTLNGGAMTINTSKIQMNEKFVTDFYNNEESLVQNTFITGGDSINGINKNSTATKAWTVSNAFGDYTFNIGAKDGSTKAWVEAYAKTNVTDVYAVEAQLKKNWGNDVISNGLAGATSLAAQALLNPLDPNALQMFDTNGDANYAMLKALATNKASFDIGGGISGTMDAGIMGGMNGQIASGPIFVAQDTFRDITTGLHSRLDAYRKVIECINVAPAANGSYTAPVVDPYAAAPAAYGSLGLAEVDRYMNRFWVGGFGTWQKANARNGFDGYKYDGAGVSLGYDRAFGPAVLGASFTYVEGNYEDETSVSNDSKIKQYVANAYATYNATSGFFATLMGGYNYGDNKLRELRGNLMTDRDFHTHNFYAGGRIGYDIEPCDNLSITPAVGADFFWSKSSQYDVKFDSGVSPWHYNEMTNHNIEIPVEVKVAYDVNFGQDKTLTLMANGGYAYNLNDHGVWGSVDYNGTNAQGIQAVGRQLGHHAWKGGAGIRFRMNNWDVGAKYDYQGRSNYSAHRLTAQVGYSF